MTFIPNSNLISQRADLIHSALASVSSERDVFVAWAAQMGATVPIGTIINIAGASYRYSGSGSAIVALPGWRANGIATPEHHGAAGDGVTDDTAAIYAWLMAGGGEAWRSNKTYLHDPMVITVPIRVTSRATFKQRTGWANWTLVTGTIECRADVTCEHDDLLGE